MKTFYHLLANTLVASVTNFTIWFAITFYVYLQTRSVFATAIIAGIYAAFTAATGIWFGSLVDHYRKRNVMLGSSIVSLIFYVASFILYATQPAATFKDPTNPILWIFILLVMFGVLVGNLRMIAMPTVVTLLIEPDKRDRANGLVGTASGISFLITSVISGFLVAAGGMYYALILAMIVMYACIVHLALIKVEEKQIVHADGHQKVDLKGTYKLVRGVPGLFWLILFTTFNNFLGGVFMALMDAYGLSLVSVQVWGLLWGFLSTGFIVGGLVIAKVGLGKNPVRALLLANLVIWTVSCLFTVRESIILTTIGMYIYMVVFPYIEASEATILQKVVPFERQGRVFGFAQSLEQLATPVTAFLIGPIAQFIAIPWMTTGGGADLIGSWFGTGADRGMALVFTLTGVIGLIATLAALRSKPYKRLSQRYLESGDTNVPQHQTAV
ncbi:MAG: transporter [Candidatus Saccharibacteria bacterium]|nr:transporter [Candidatus Saccharibacteria bacterium]